MAQLIDELFQRAFDNEWLRQRNDQATFTVPPGSRYLTLTRDAEGSPEYDTAGPLCSEPVTVREILAPGQYPRATKDGVKRAWSIPGAGRDARFETTGTIPDLNPVKE